MGIYQGRVSRNSVRVVWIMDCLIDCMLGFTMDCRRLCMAGTEDYASTRLSRGPIVIIRWYTVRFVCELCRCACAGHCTTCALRFAASFSACCLTLSFSRSSASAALRLTPFAAAIFILSTCSANDGTCDIFDYGVGKGTTVSVCGCQDRECVGISAATDYVT